MKAEGLKQAYDALASVICNVEWKVNGKELKEEPIEEKVDTISLKIKKKKKNPYEEEKVIPEQEELVFGVEHSGLHLALKKIAKMDKDKTKSGLFGNSLAAVLTSTTVKLIKFSQAVASY